MRDRVEQFLWCLAALALCALLAVRQAHADTPPFPYATGSTLSVIWDDATKSDLVERSTRGGASATQAASYDATDAELVTDGLTAGPRSGRVYAGVNAASVTPSSTIVGMIHEFAWNGTNEVPRPATISYPKTIYVATSGGSNNYSGAHPLLAKATLAGAAAVAVAGDTVLVLGGIHASNTEATFVAGVTLMGQGKDVSKISGDPGGATSALIRYDGRMTIRDLWIAAPATQSDGQAVGSTAGGAAPVLTMRDVRVEGSTDTVSFNAPASGTAFLDWQGGELVTNNWDGLISVACALDGVVKDVKVRGRWKGFYLISTTQTMNLTLDGVTGNESFGSLSTSHALVFGNVTSTGKIRIRTKNCDFKGDSYSVYLDAGTGGGTATWEDDGKLINTNYALLNGATKTFTNADAVAEELLAEHAGAGTFAKAAADILDDTGTSGVAVAANAIGAPQIAADAIGASELAAAGVSEIQTGLSTLSAPQVAAAVWDEPIAGNATAATFGAVVAVDTPDAIDAVDTGFEPIAPIKVHELRTWRPSATNGSRSDTVRTIKAFAGTVTFAVEPLLNTDADIQSVTSVVVTGPASETGTNHQLRADGRAAHFDMTSVTTTGTYTIIVTVLTKDNQTLALECKLVVR